VTTLPRKVAVIGAGDIGCGWAALCASAGWPVTIFDGDARSLERATTEVPRRTRALVALERAPQGVVEHGIGEFRAGRSLLATVQDADWVIEAITEDLFAKQKLFNAIDGLAPADALFTSSTGGLAPADLFARCRHQERGLVAHPLNPPEIVPLVELIPGTRTAPAALTRALEYLRAIGRVPIILKKAVPGFVVGRVAAAVWRECIELVLAGVVDVDELDRAVSLGPALGWAAAGPHLTYHLAAGEGGVTGFLQHLLTSFEDWWSQLATWQKLDPERQRTLIQAIERAYKGKVDALRDARDRRLGAIPRALEQARAT